MVRMVAGGYSRGELYVGLWSTGGGKWLRNWVRFVIFADIIAAKSTMVA